MDKVKEYLELARKHHFWLLCGVAAFAGLIAWFMSTGKLAAEFNSRKSAIDGQINSLKGITEPWPGETWTTGMQETTKKAKENVRAAWTFLYDSQKKNVFIWPEPLREDFHTEIAKVENDKQKFLLEKYRVRYQNLVRGFAKQLPKIVDAEVVEDQQNGVGNRPNRPEMELDREGNPIYEDHRVLWEPQSQQEIFDTFDWIEEPTTPGIRMAQEELWVYEALCKVIAEVNKGSAGSHDASITGIQEMSVAYLAQEGDATTGGSGMEGWQRIERVKPAGSGGPGGEMSEAAPMAGPGGFESEFGPGGSGGPGGMPDPKTRYKGTGNGGGEIGGRRGGNLFSPSSPGGTADTGAAPADPDEIWKGWRYVDEQGKPLKTAAEVDSSSLEFNLMPFRMQLTINPRDLDRLLVAFHKSVLPLEVKQMRVGDDLGTSGRGRGMRMRGGGGGRGRGFEGEFGAPRARTIPGGGANGMLEQRTVNIEISGVACLMKRPDPALLDAPPTDGAMPADGTAPPADGTTPAVPSVSKPIQRDPVAWHDPTAPAGRWPSG